MRGGEVSPDGWMVGEGDMGGKGLNRCIKERWVGGRCGGNSSTHSFIHPKLSLNPFFPPNTQPFLPQPPSANTHPCIYLFIPFST